MLMNAEVPADSYEYLLFIPYIEGSYAVVSEPMIGSIAHSVVLLQLPEDADAQAVAAEIETNMDPRKWICVEADDMKVAGCGDVVMLIMVSTTGDMTAQSFVDAFQSVAGRDCDFVI